YFAQIRRKEEVPPPLSPHTSKKRNFKTRSRGVPDPPQGRALRRLRRPVQGRRDRPAGQAGRPGGQRPALTGAAAARPDRAGHGPPAEVSPGLQVPDRYVKRGAIPGGDGRGRLICAGLWLEDPFPSDRLQAIIDGQTLVDLPPLAGGAHVASRRSASSRS